MRAQLAAGAHIGWPSRALAAALGTLVVFVVGGSVGAGDLSALLKGPLMLLLAACFFAAAIAGREVDPLTPVYAVVSWLRKCVAAWRRPATAAQRARLRELGERAPLVLPADAASRRIAALESRLPATTAQQLELLRLGAPRGVFTRASADRFLARCREWAEWEAAVAWREGWLEAGVDIVHGEVLTPRERAAFDEATARVFAAGIPYPLPAELPAWSVPAETARLQLAMDLPGWLDAAQRDQVAAGQLRRVLTEEELREFVPGVVELWRREPDIEPEAAFAYLLARERPALHTDPWGAREFARACDAHLADPST